MYVPNRSLETIMRCQFCKHNRHPSGAIFNSFLIFSTLFRSATLFHLFFINKIKKNEEEEKNQRPKELKIKSNNAIECIQNEFNSTYLVINNYFISDSIRSINLLRSVETSFVRCICSFFTLNFN